MKIKVPESVLKKMVSGLDGRRNSDVELIVDKDRLVIGMVEWTRAAYEADRNRVIVKRGKL